MTNNPTIDGVIISYELGERIYAWLDSLNSKSGDVNEADELRALLDAPVLEPASDLREHCKQCAEVVKTWPEWKRGCLGGEPVVERQPDPIIGVLKANLAEGVKPSFSGGDLKHLIRLLESPPEVAALQSTIAQLQAEQQLLQSTVARYLDRIAELESGRGEPIGWIDEPYAGWLKDKSSGWATVWGTDGADNPSRRKPSIALFAAPPAPVAVVIDERAEFDAWAVKHGRVVGYNGWRNDFEVWRARACLDVTAALNGVRK